MNADFYQAQVRYWGEKYFPHLLPEHRTQLVRELLRLHLRPKAQPTEHPHPTPEPTQSPT